MVAELARRIGDPLLREMLLAPVSLYGNAREDDMDWDAFGVLFLSLFLEGFCRPTGGIRTLRSPAVDRGLARVEFGSSPIYQNLLVSPDLRTTALLAQQLLDLVHGDRHEPGPHPLGVAHLAELAPRDGPGGLDGLLSHGVIATDDRRDPKF